MATDGHPETTIRLHRLLQRAICAGKCSPSLHSNVVLESHRTSAAARGLPEEEGGWAGVCSWEPPPLPEQRRWDLDGMWAAICISPLHKLLRGQTCSLPVSMIFYLLLFLHPPALHRLMEFLPCVKPWKVQCFSITKPLPTPSQMHSPGSILCNHALDSVCCSSQHSLEIREGQSVPGFTVRAHIIKVEANTEKNRCPFKCVSLGDPKSIHF